MDEINMFVPNMIKFVLILSSAGFWILFVNLIVQSIKIRKMKKENSYNSELNELSQKKIKHLRNQIMLSIVLGIILFIINILLGSMTEISAQIDMYIY